MDSKRRAIGWIWMLGMVASSSLMTLVVGCALDKDGNRPQGVFDRIGGHGNGQNVLEPKRCVLKVAILKRPFQDPAINEIIWRGADEQVLSAKERRALEANGLRVGRLIGDLPIEIETIMKDEAPQRKVSPAIFAMESGDPSVITASDPVEQVSLIVSRENRVTGRDYRNASGFFRLTPQHDGAGGVSIRLVPEIHYGDIQKSWAAAPTAGPAPQEFTTKFAQPEDVFRELGVTLVLAPQQVAVIGCNPVRTSSLGGVLMTQNEPNSDLKWQKLILIWASRNMNGVMAENSKGSDRPKRSKRNTSPIREPEAQPNRRPIPMDPADAPAPPAQSVPGTDSVKSNSQGQGVQAELSGRDLSSGE